MYSTIRLCPLQIPQQWPSWFGAVRSIPEWVAPTLINEVNSSNPFTTEENFDVKSTRIFVTLHPPGCSVSFCLLFFLNLSWVVVWLFPFLCCLWIREAAAAILLHLTSRANLDYYLRQPTITSSIPRGFLHPSGCSVSFLPLS
jgi:hypothetical protein